MAAGYFSPRPEAYALSFVTISASIHLPRSSCRKLVCTLTTSPSSQLGAGKGAASSRAHPPFGGLGCPAGAAIGLFSMLQWQDPRLERAWQRKWDADNAGLDAATSLQTLLFPSLIARTVRLRRRPPPPPALLGACASACSFVCVWPLA